MTKVSLRKADKKHGAPGPQEQPARQQLLSLEEAVKDWVDEKPADARIKVETPDTDSEQAPKLHQRVLAAFIDTSTASKVIKSLVALMAIIVLGWGPIERLWAVTSAEATINARIITLRAPIDGQIKANPRHLGIGQQYALGDEVLTIENSRADLTYLNNLKRDRAQLKAEINNFESRQRSLERQHAQLLVQEQRFRTGRIAQLQKRLAIIGAQISSSEADHQLAETALRRSAHLWHRGLTTSAAYQRSVRDERVAQQAVKREQERRNEAQVELKALQAGTYLGDSYNDTPESSRRAREVQLMIEDVANRGASARNRLIALDSSISKEQERADERSRATIAANIKGRVWEVLTAPDEYVRAGQDLVRLIDCGSAYITANVSESAYHYLSVGQQASFQPRNGSKPLGGWIVSLNGLATISSNHAIQPASLTREPYHVTIEFPELTNSKECLVGQSGLVTFGSARRLPRPEPSAAGPAQ